MGSGEVDRKGDGSCQHSIRKSEARKGIRRGPPANKHIRKILTPRAPFRLRTDHQSEVMKRLSAPITFEFEPLKARTSFVDLCGVLRSLIREMLPERSLLVSRSWPSLKMERSTILPRGIQTITTQVCFKEEQDWAKAIPWDQLAKRTGDSIVFTDWEFECQRITMRMYQVIPPLNAFVLMTRAKP